MSTKFHAHLNIKTVYSVLNSTVKIEDLVEKAKKYGYETLAITDHNNLYGAYKFYKTCAENNIKPIIGIEAVITNMDAKEKNQEEKRYTLTILAMNKNGYQDLVNLSTWAHMHKYHEPRIDYEILKKYSRSRQLIGMSGSIEGEIPSMILNMYSEKEIVNKIKFYQKIFDGKFYLEIIDNDHYNQIHVNEILYKISQKYNFPIVATNDVRFMHENEKDAHDCLQAIKIKGSFNDGRFKSKLESTSNWFKPKDIITKNLSKYEEALKNTRYIVGTINANYFNDIKIHMPEAENESVLFNRLARICNTNLNKLNRFLTYDQKVIYKERLSKELGLIKKYNIATYFMILEDIMAFCRKNNIYTGAGRGSAAGSLVSYLSKITKVDPIKYGLIFERFINDGRLKTGNLPDIDIDIQDTRRHEVVEYIRKKYGRHKTCNIITFNFLKDKSAIKGAARSLGVDFITSNEITKSLPEDFTFETINQYPEIMQYKAKHPKIFSLAQVIRGCVQHVGTHAAGIVISDEVLTNIIPLTNIKDKNQEEQITSQFDMKSIEGVGLIKVDALALNTLNIIKETVDLIKEKEGRYIDITKIKDNEQIVFDKIFSPKMLTGIFQFSSIHSNIMKKAIHKINPQSIEELTVVTSIARPGAKDFIDIYAENKKNPHEIKYIDDSLRNILEETKGIIIYQEQVMAICQQFAGFSLEKADNIRRGIGKKIPHVLQSLSDIFVDGAISKGHSEEKAAEIYSLFVAFGDYAFNKSHALAYSITSYQTAWLKTYYTIYYVTAYLNNEMIHKNKAPEDREKIMHEIQRECSKMGIIIMAPNINKSDIYFTIEDKKIRYGFAAIKNVGMPVAKKIVQHRKNGYTSFVEFLIKNNKGSCNKRALQSLIMSNTFCDLIDNRYILMQKSEDIRKFLDKQRKNMEESEQLIFDFVEKVNDDNMGLFDKENLFTDDEIYEKEKELMGLYATGHPFDKWKKFFDKAKNKVEEIIYCEEDKEMHLCIYAKRIKRIITKKKKYMCFIDGEDYTGRVSITIFPDLFKEMSSVLEEEKIYFVKGKTNIYNERTSIVASKIGRI